MAEPDADEILARMRGDSEHDWPDLLLHDLAQAPLVSEHELSVTRNPGDVLSPAQLAVVTAASHGLSNQEIGVVLGITPVAAKDRLREVQRKLGGKNRAHACSNAIRQGLIV